MLGPAAQAREIIRKGDTVIIPLRGEVSPALYLFLRRGIKAAESAEASAIVIEMNTYGGRPHSPEGNTRALHPGSLPPHTLLPSNPPPAPPLPSPSPKPYSYQPPRAT